MILGIVGGTGPEGKGLGLRFAMAGHRVLLGSRNGERAAAAAAAVASLVNTGAAVTIQGVLNQDAAAQAEIALVTVPFEGQQATLESLKAQLEGKIVVSTVAPLTFQKGVARAVLVPEGSAAQQAQRLLPRSQVVAAFQNISAVDLVEPEVSIEADVIVCSDHADAKKRIMALAEQIKGVRAVDGGGLENARYVEELTVLLLNINRVYKSRSKVRIVGI